MWNPITRGVNYDSKKVIERLRFYAEKYYDAQNFKLAKTLRETAVGIEIKIIPAEVGMKLLLKTIEDYKEDTLV